MATVQFQAGHAKAEWPNATATGLQGKAITFSHSLTGMNASGAVRSSQGAHCDLQLLQPILQAEQ